MYSIIWFVVIWGKLESLVIVVYGVLVFQPVPISIASLKFDLEEGLTTNNPKLFISLMNYNEKYGVR